MKWRTLDTSESEAWHQLLRQQPARDVYFQPEYHRAHELSGDGTAKVFVAEDQGRALFYPFMLRPINSVAGLPIAESWFDIESVYGYSGPLSNTSDSGFLSAAWECFESCCRENFVVAEFVRFHPMMDNFLFADSSYMVSMDRETVVVNLNRTQEDLWQSYSPSHRNKIRKAQKNGLQCEEWPLPRGIDHFKKLYRETMNRVGAFGYYYFSDTYFDALMELLGQRLRLFVVLSSGTVVAASLFLLSDESIHYHLTGSSRELMHLAPVPLLLHTVALWGNQRGYRALHLGGGATPDPRDSLFTFKASISKLRRTYYTGKRIRNPEVYEKLCSLWMRRAHVSTKPNYFLLYRLNAEKCASI